MEERIGKSLEDKESKRNEDEVHKVIPREEEAKEKGCISKNQVQDTHQKNPESSLSNGSAESEMKMRKKKALLRFRCMVEDAILGNYLVSKPKRFPSRQETRMAREITLWGVPLLPSKGHEGTDKVLMKFLKARDFKAHEALQMLRNTLKWRKENNADAILEEDLHLGLDKVVYINSVDKQGHPLYYSVYGAFKDKELYSKMLGTEEDREKYLRWKIQSMEKSIKQLSFKDGGADSIVQITDLKNSPGPEMKELRLVTRKLLLLLEANYPEIVHKNILINVPFWFYTSHLVLSKLMTLRAKRKFILVRPSKVTKTLLKYISAEHLPVEYGGLKRENDVDFCPDEHKASELIVLPNSSRSFKIPVDKAGVTLVWEFTVVGWDVTYKEEFIPDDEGSYRILLRKEKDKKMGESVRNSFYISESGKLVITIDNPNLNKKRVYFRSKEKPTSLPASFSFIN